MKNELARLARPGAFFERVHQIFESKKKLALESRLPVLARLKGNLF